MAYKMTSFAPSDVIACPHCSHLALRKRLRSVNFYGATRWSDGYFSCFPGLPAFTRCARCHGVFWLDDAEVIGTLPDHNSEPPRSRYLGFVRRFAGLKSRPVRQAVSDEWLWAQPVDHPDTDALVIGIENLTEVGTPEREQRLRRLLWWRFNDQHRVSVRKGSGISATIRNAHERSNLLRLLDLSGEVDSEASIEYVEILRELGQFDEAREALALVNPDTNGVALLLAKINARDTKVCITQQ